jgi:hypothetical protein
MIDGDCLFRSGLPRTGYRDLQGISGNFDERISDSAISMSW